MKNQEANDLRVQNRQLMEENTRLTDLTRMLLSSQAFSGFLSELSGTVPPSSAGSLQQPQSQSSSQPVPKDINPHQLARHLQDQQQQIGLATISERPVDFSLVGNTTSASRWSASMGLNNFPVYSLTKVPEGPTLDIERLSGKATADRPFQAPEFQAHEATKRDMPTIVYARTLLEAEGLSPPSRPIHTLSDVELDETKFALYAKTSVNRSKTSTALTWNAHHMPHTQKANIHTDLVVDTCESEAVAALRLATMCSRIDAVSARIAAVTSHLS
jgi:bZIP-type transcription factor MBZ1